MNATISSAPSNELVVLFNAVGDPTRFMLIKLLATEKHICVSELADKVGISPAGASQHLKILETAGLIERNRNGQKICYMLKKDSPANRKVLQLVVKGGE